MIEFFFVFFKKIFTEPGIAVIAVSLCVNAVLLPVYTAADRWQREERELQKRMKKKLSDIRAVFKGDERQMITNTYYRQMGYSPLSALRSSAGLLIQIPFFLAAYTFLSHTPNLAGVSFLFLRNLSDPDALLHIKLFSTDFAVNVLPIAMTVINLLSALVYTQDLGRRDKIQLYGMALIFLVLLYSSPSGLVLYWTCNNVFSLGKNIASAKMKHPTVALHIIASLVGIVLIAGSVTQQFNLERYTILIVALGVALILTPFAWKWFMQRLSASAFLSHPDKVLYFVSCAALFFLLGLLIPTQVMADAASDFADPWGFIVRTFVQGSVVCLMLPALVWSFASVNVRKALVFLIPCGAALALICVFALSASYGVMTTSFRIEEPELISRAFPLWANAAAVLAALVIPLIFFLKKKLDILSGVFGVVAAVLAVMSVINMVHLENELKENALIKERIAANESVEIGGGHGDIVFPFTKTGTNTFIMFLDRAVGIGLYTALEALPELSADLDGFTWYPNTLSFGDCTVTGVPAMFGGYDYAPLDVNARGDKLLADKVNEALTLLPRIFGTAGARVSVTDPPLTNMRFVSDPTVFKGIPNTTVQNLDGRFNKRYTTEFPQKKERFVDSFDFDVLFRYCLFRAAPPVLRYGIHYKGWWWRDSANNNFERALTEYSTLYYLSDICSADDGADTLNIFTNETTHEAGSFLSDLTLRAEPNEYDYLSEYMYTYQAAMRAIAVWIDHLKELGVYDNTRIIVASDHGTLFPNTRFAVAGMEWFNPLLMVKEPGARGVLSVSPEFMMNADVPLIALLALGGERINPYLGTPLRRPFDSAAGNSADNTSGDVSVVEAVSSQPNRHGQYRFNLTRERELIKRDIFQPDAWLPWRDITRGESAE